MNDISLIVAMLMGVAIGACLPTLANALRGWMRRRWFKPALLHMDPPPSRRHAKAGAEALTPVAAPSTDETV